MVCCESYSTTVGRETEKESFVTIYGNFWKSNLQCHDTRIIRLNEFMPRSTCRDSAVLTADDESTSVLWDAQLGVSALRSFQTGKKLKKEDRAVCGDRVYSHDTEG